MSFLPIVINIPNRFVPFVCSLIILCHASCEAFMVPNQPLENNPCTTCRKISDKFIEVSLSSSPRFKNKMNKFFHEFSRFLKERLIVILEGKFVKLENLFCLIIIFFRGNTDWEEKKLKGYAKR